MLTGSKFDMKDYVYQIAPQDTKINVGNNRGSDIIAIKKYSKKACGKHVASISNIKIIK